MIIVEQCSPKESYILLDPLKPTDLEEGSCHENITPTQEWGF